MMPSGSSSSTSGRLVMPACKARVLPQLARPKVHEFNGLGLRKKTTAFLRHVQRRLSRVSLTRGLDRGEARALRLPAALHLPAPIQRLQRLGRERDDAAARGFGREYHVDAARWRADLQVRDERGALFRAQGAEAGAMATSDGTRSGNQLPKLMTSA